MRTKADSSRAQLLGERPNKDFKGGQSEKLAIAELRRKRKRRISGRRIIGRR